MDTEHLFMLPINWLNHWEFTYVNVDIVQNFYNAFHTPTSFYIEKYFESWNPKIHGPCNYLQSFYVAALIDKCGTTKHYPLAMYQNGISKVTRSSVTGKLDNIIPSSYSDSATKSKRNNNCRDTFKFQMRNIVYL